jgi:hypothetical protein
MKPLARISGSELARLQEMLLGQNQYGVHGFIGKRIGEKHCLAPGEMAFRHLLRQETRGHLADVFRAKRALEPGLALAFHKTAVVDWAKVPGAELQDAGHVSAQWIAPYLYHQVLALEFVERVQEGEVAGAGLEREGHQSTPGKWRARLRALPPRVFPIRPRRGRRI